MENVRTIIRTLEFVVQFVDQSKSFPTTDEYYYPTIVIIIRTFIVFYNAVVQQSLIYHLPSTISHL